jgi:sucrose phosphorylase
VVRASLRLIRFRNNHPAFDGEFATISGHKRITLTWTAGADSARLDANLATGGAEVTWTTGGAARTAGLAELP